MNTAAFILVIILSVFLAFFLIVGIILTIYLIRLTKEIRKIVHTTGQTVEHIGAAVSGFSRLSSPLFVADLIGKYIKKYTSSKKKGD